MQTTGFSGVKRGFRVDGVDGGNPLRGWGGLREEAHVQLQGLSNEVPSPADAGTPEQETVDAPAPPLVEQGEGADQGLSDRVSRVTFPRFLSRAGCNEDFTRVSSGEARAMV